MARLRGGGPVIAVALFLLLIAVGLFGGRLAPHEPIYYVIEHGSGSRPYAPGTVFALGSDQLGRDVLSLVLAGASTTLTIVLVAGTARVGAGVLAAWIGARFRSARAALDASADLVAAVPATLAALVLIKAFVGERADLSMFVAALLVLGWSGPYRVIRAELDRLAASRFIEGARALGVSGARIFWRHQLPHLAPVLLVNLSQQVVASLVLIAELGVLGTAVGLTRHVDLGASVTRVLPGQIDVARVPDLPEWGGLLAGSRTVEALWVSRWLILVPGLAFAAAAVAVSIIGLALARRYARRDVVAEVSGPGLRVIVALVLVVGAVSIAVPERYASAHDWAESARAALQPAGDPELAFASAGLRPVSGTFGLRRETTNVLQTGPASVSVGATTLAEPWPREPAANADRARTMRSFVTRTTGGGLVEAPLVFVGRGLSPTDHPPRPQLVGAAPVRDYAQLIRDYDYADDYASVDVRGKVVLLVRFLGFRGPGPNPSRQDHTPGVPVERSIRIAIERGAAAVLLVDPALWLYTDVATGFSVFEGDLVGGISPYTRAERASPPAGADGVPVVILGVESARALVESYDIDLGPFVGYDDANDPGRRVSAARELGVTARVEVPLERRSAAVTSYLGEVAAPADAERVLVWGIRRADDPAALEVMSAVGRAFAARSVPFIFVDFDPAIDPEANARAVREALGDRRIGLVLVLDDLSGSALRFTTTHGELIQALDLYAERANAPHEPTLTTAGTADVAGRRPYADLKTVVLSGHGAEGDLRPAAAAVIGYIGGRIALGAPELPR